jgi:hypothetical protein
VGFALKSGLLEAHVTRALPSASTQLDFLNKLQRILNEGLFVASYKFALVLALAELAVERTPAGDGSLPIPLQELSDRFITLYWHQTAPFAPGVVLAQNRGRQASAITIISQFRAYAPTLAAARRHPRWPHLVRRITRLLNECHFGGFSSQGSIGSISFMKNG